MIIAGLTGGIASGKSTVSAILAEAGAIIVDADVIAREVVAPGRPAYEDILDAFGRDILLPSGMLDRIRLGDIIFNDPSKKARLNAIVHPRVYRRMEEAIIDIAATKPDAVTILDIPLLMETGKKGRDLAEVIVVYVPEAVQLKRLMVRDQIDRDAALARIRSQMPIEEKRRLATIVIDNSGAIEKTRARALNLYADLCRPSKKHLTWVRK